VTLTSVSDDDLGDELTLVWQVEAGRRVLPASDLSIEEYQLEPVAKALEMPRVNLLIADDVSLGKTIDAGLIIQELVLRHVPNGWRWSGGRC